MSRPLADARTTQRRDEEDASLRMAIADPIATWLEMLTRLMRLPADQSQQIRDELESHLRERVRDLMLEGLHEAEAAREAIEELGDAAAVAQNFVRAHRTPLRRFVMHLTLFSLGAAVVTAGVLVASSAGQGRGVNVAFERNTSDVAPASFEKIRVSIAADTKLQDIAKLVSDKANKPVFVHWDALESEAKLTPASMVGQAIGNVPMSVAMELVADAMVPGEGALVWRFRDSLIELSTQHHMDMRERRMASYDISDLLTVLVDRRFGAVAEDVRMSAERQLEHEIADLIQEIIDPSLWKNNGGEVANIRAYGSRLFIEAPERMHTRVQWVLGQLRDGASLQAKAADERQKAAPQQSGGLGEQHARGTNRPSTGGGGAGGTGGAGFGGEGGRGADGEPGQPGMGGRGGAGGAGGGGRGGDGGGSAEPR